MPYDLRGYVKRFGSNLWVAGTQDMSPATALILPSAAGAAPTANGDIRYDTTLNRYVTGGGNFAGMGSLPRLIAQSAPPNDLLDAAVITTTETAFATSLALPANYFVNGKALLIMVSFVVASTNSPTFKLRLRTQKSGPTNVNLIEHTATAVGVTNIVSSGIYQIMGTAAAGASVNVFSCCLAHSIETPISSKNNIAQPVAMATNAPQTIQFTLTFGAGTAGNTMNLRQFSAYEVG